MSSRGHTPALLYEMRRVSERQAFHRDTFWSGGTSPRRRDRQRDHSSSTSILDSIAEDVFLSSLSDSARSSEEEEEEEEEEEQEASSEEDYSASEPCRKIETLGLEYLNPVWNSLAKYESRKRIQQYHDNQRTKAINRVLETLKRDRVSFERSFAALRAEEKRRQLEKERVKWLAEDRRPFTQVEQDLISRVLRGRANEVLASGFNTELTREDMRRLRDTEWLNDEVINFYLNLIKQRSDMTKKSDWPKCHVLNTFFYPLLSDKGGYNYARVQKWTRRVDLFAMDRIIIPIHLGNHWCLAVINIQDRRFEYYDSLGSPNPTCLKRLRQYLQDEAQDKKGIKLDLLDWTDYQPREIPMQRNGYDCGVFACKFAECIASGRPFYFSQVDMPLYRKRMMLSIMNKCIS
jgi:sentrin-specific protease 1